MSTIIEEYEPIGGSRILLPTFVDAGTVTASSAEAAAPPSNLQNKFRGKTWQSIGCAAEYVDVDLGQERSINALALVNHNLSYDAELQVSLGSSQGAADVGEGSFPAWAPLFAFIDSIPHGYGGFVSDLEAERLYWTGHLRLIYFEESLGAPWLRLGITDPGNAAGFLQAGRLLAGTYVAAAKQPIVGTGNRPVDPSVVSYSQGGQGWKDRLPQYREATYQYTYTPGDETYVVWYDFLRRVGTGAPFVFDAFPAMTNKVDLRLNNLLYCEIPQDAIQPVQISHRARGAVSLQIRESL